MWDLMGENFAELSAMALAALFVSALWLVPMSKMASERQGSLWALGLMTAGWALTEWAQAQKPAWHVFWLQMVESANSASETFLVVLAPAAVLFWFLSAGKGDRKGT